MKRRWPGSPMTIKVFVQVRRASVSCLVSSRSGVLLPGRSLSVKTHLIRTESSEARSHFVIRHPKKGISTNKPTCSLCQAAQSSPPSQLQAPRTWVSDGTVEVETLVAVKLRQKSRRSRVKGFPEGASCTSYLTLAQLCQYFVSCGQAILSQTMELSRVTPC